jgi:hypothetical protein
MLALPTQKPSIIGLLPKLPLRDFEWIVRCREIVAGRSQDRILHATALSLMARIFLNNCVTCCSSNSWSGPVGATSVNGGS